LGNVPVTLLTHRCNRWGIANGSENIIMHSPYTTLIFDLYRIELPAVTLFAVGAKYDDSASVISGNTFIVFLAAA